MNMSDIQICRICLCKGVKLYDYNRYYLKQAYEDVLARKVVESDNLPKYFCYLCAHMLYKFHKFKEKCCQGEKLLQEFFGSRPITSASISRLQKQSKDLQVQLDIVTVSKKVRTCNIKRKKTDINIRQIELPEIIECKEIPDSDDSMDNKDLAEIKNEMVEKELETLKDEENVAIEMVNTDEVIAEPADQTLPEFVDDRFSDDDNFPESLDNESTIKEELTHKISDIELNDNKVINETKSKKKQKINKSKKNLVKKKAKKFEVRSSKTDALDPKHWVKINFTEEEAEEEFKARAQNKKYLAAAFHCTDCYKGFSKEDMLKRHKESKHSEVLGPVVCRFCKMRFKWKCFLSRHITQHYTKFKCLRCNLVCPLESTAVLHNDYHNGVKWECKHCGEEFNHVSTYYTHLRSHRSEYLCTLCGVSFVSDLGLTMHKKKLHFNVVPTPEEEVNTYCARCDIKFETLMAYEEHVNHSAKHIEGIEDLEDQTPIVPVAERKKRNRGRRRTPRKQTHCSLCDITFPSEAAYIKHHSEEHKEEPCTIRSKEVQRHICEICGASIATTSIASHLNTHTREKIFTCDICQMQFNSKSSMQRHQLTHTGEKPHECTLCDKRFTQKCSMKLHYRTFHLKEPYPKRNRKKNIIQQELEDYSITECSEENVKVNKWR